MRYLVPVAIAAWILSCSADSKKDVSPPNGSGGAAATGGQGGVAQGGGGAGTGTGTGTGSGTATGTATGTGGSSTGGSGTGGATLGCPQGAIVCDGTIAKVCDGNGGYLSEEECAPGVCAPNIGCAVCVPGEGSCDGEFATVCNPDGMGVTEQHCDPLQGMSCDPDSGTCVGACAPQNLELSYVGCDYYPTITNNDWLDYYGDNRWTVFRFAVAVANTTPATANITVTQGATTIATEVVDPNSVQIIELPWVMDLADAVEQGTNTAIVTDGAYRLRSDQPITVYQYNPLDYTDGGSMFTYTNDASLLLPATAWTGNYRVVTRNHFSGILPSIYAVTASQDGTTVTVTPSATGGTVYAGAGIGSDGAGTVTLDEGDVLQVQSTSGGSDPDPSDLTGTLITADKPVQVIGAHMCVYIPHTHSACDHLEESMPPLETLGLEYIVSSPLISPSSTKGRMVRVIATQDATTVSYDPPQSGAPDSLTNAGDYFEIAVTTADFKVSADKPVLVAQYMVGQSYPGGSTGDPAFTMAVPILQYRTDYLFHAPTNYEASYVNVIAPTGTEVTLDGAAVTGWTTVGTTGFDVAKVQLDDSGNGNHVITSALPFGVTVYGYGQYTSYWYPGGLDLTPLGL